MSSYYFTIIGTRDNPLYELEFSSFKSNSLAAVYGNNVIPGQSQFSANVKEILPFISHSSLDIVEDATWSSNQFSLGRIDSFYGLSVNAFVTQGNIKFILCYDSPGTNSNGVAGVGSTTSSSKNDDNAIKQFFTEVNELYVKCLLNPLYSVNDAIKSPDFDLKIKLSARKYL
ncbi:trafficking protein particle complex subunit 20 [[Candida] anglica]|uniref:Trafficking protein particle complex subunit 20 n=1 Tax=[Candida] anglica TaxID=148631 RepID=A0ABP0ED16_9ASCO